MAKTFQRYLEPYIQDVLSQKMAFLGGPRQVGKTTLCLQFLNPPTVTNPNYLNWDDIHSKHKLRQGQLPPGKLLVIDEIHKYSLWRNLLKGFYDKNKGLQNYLITGSARLDYYRRGGDSLMGRYRYLRLHPLTASELKLTQLSDLRSLLQFGGFPEPFFLQSEKEAKLWRKERIYRIVNDDITSLEKLNEYSRIELLAELLPEKVGSLLSVQSLEEDLQVSQKTIAHWIEILERIYYVFRIYPYGAPRIKSLKKAPKIYCWDWSEITDEGARFENMVASHLLKYCHFHEDTEGDKYELRYLRDTHQHEVDFVVLKNKKPLFAVECKSGEKQVSKSAVYFRNQTSIPRFYQTHLGQSDYLSPDGIRVIPFLKLCQELELV